MATKFFVFEGPDGVGKTTLAGRLNATLNQRRGSCLLSFPGREAGTLGEHIYRLYHDPSLFGIPRLSVASEQLLLTAAHADVIENRVIPSLASGSAVVLDRYWWSTWVYARFCKVDPELTEYLLKLEMSLWKGITPTCIFLVSSSNPYKPNIDPIGWRTLKELYLSLREEYNVPNVKIVDIDNSGNLETAVAAVLREARL